MASLLDLLMAAAAVQASDLHLSIGSPPRARVNGELRELEGASLTPELTESIVQAILTDRQLETLRELGEVDLAFGAAGVGRVRGSVFSQKGSVGAVFRLIPARLKPIEELGLPPIVASFAERPRGLVLVAGPTGSGKSTTLAALVDLVNRRRRAHILTIEDPIEFVHDHKEALVNQRELHTDTRSFGAALRAALREDPDVVLVGEMRDLETMEAAMTLAETGHLTLATLHTNSAAQTVTRIVDVFPVHQQAGVRAQLAHVLEGIVCQLLLPRRDGAGRAAAFEVLVATPAIRTLIRDDKVHQIYGIVQAGRQKLGMQTMTQALARLVGDGLVSRESALRASSHREELLALLDRQAPLVTPEAWPSERTGD